MKHKTTLLYILLVTCLPIFAQNAETAQKLFNDKRYAEAREQYRALLRKNPKSALNNYRYARCCYELGDAALAIKHFELAGERYPLRNFYLGELYFEAYEFEKSIEAYNKYMPTLETDDHRLPTLRRKTEQAELANRLLARVEDIAIVDSMVVDKADFLDFYRFSSELGSLQQARLPLSPTRTEDKISYTTQRQDRMYFSDSIEGRMDIFTSFRLLDGWSRPVSLSDAINSDGNENYPFLMADGVTMYFASDGESSIGGYDIFITKYVPATDMYLTPENVGMPFNSPYNDYMMLVDEINGMGWFATDRYLPEGKVCIYMFIPNETKKIVRSDDDTHVRNTAQLKSFRQAEASVATAVTKKPQTPAIEEKGMEFIVTDHVVYTHVNQFKSAEARKGWQELNLLTEQQDSMTLLLKNLRKEYTQTTDKTSLSAITSKILALEQQIRELNEQIRNKTIEVRNKEAETISGQ